MKIFEYSMVSYTKSVEYNTQIRTLVYVGVELFTTDM